jgi:hypothetical protein
MRLWGAALALVLVLVLRTGAAGAEEPGLRPQARSVAEAPAPPLRPQARRAGDAVPVDPAAAPAAPALPVADRAPVPPAGGAAPGQAALMVVLAAPPPADGRPAGPPLGGPPQMVMAERMMTDPPPPPVFLDAWTGMTPALRPGEDPAPDGVAPFLRPENRPETLPEVGAAVSAVTRPRLRPETPVDPAPLVAARPDAAPVFGLGAPDAPQFSPLAVAVALRPPARDPRLAEQASTRPPAPAPRGALCGIRGIEGEVIAAIRGSGGCGVAEPVRVTSVAGVRLSTAATVNCETAAALFEWVQDVAQPQLNNRLARIETMGSYDCRPRNNQAGARLSEHGKGRAIDIGGFVLSSGERITVLRDWGSRAWGETLRAMHRNACGIFGTVLGPNANRAHANHFHFDTAAYRSGAYCR